MEAALCSKLLVAVYQTARCYIPEDSRNVLCNCVFRINIHVSFRVHSKIIHPKSAVTDLGKFFSHLLCLFSRICGRLLCIETLILGEPHSLIDTDFTNIVQSFKVKISWNLCFTFSVYFLPPHVSEILAFLTFRIRFRVEDGECAVDNFLCTYI
jgi:hypothetical protein